MATRATYTNLTEASALAIRSRRWRTKWLIAPVAMMVVAAALLAAVSISHASSVAGGRSFDQGLSFASAQSYRKLAHDLPAWLGGISFSSRQVIQTRLPAVPRSLGIGHLLLPAFPTPVPNWLALCPPLVAAALVPLSRPSLSLGPWRRLLRSLRHAAGSRQERRLR